MRFLYVTAIKPATPIGKERTNKKLSVYLQAGHELAIVCGVEEGDCADVPDGVRLYPVRLNTTELPFNVIDALDETPLPSVHNNDELDIVKTSLEEAFADTIDTAVADFAPDVIVCSHLAIMTSIALDHAAGTPVAGISQSLCLSKFLNLEATRKVMARNLQRLDLVFACSVAQRRLMVESFDIDPAKVKVLYGSFDVDFFTVQCSPELKEATEPSINLSFVGKFTYKNGSRSLLNAVALLPCRPNTVTVRLFCSTDNSFQRAALDLLIRENPQKVEVVNLDDAQGLAQMFRESQVFVLPAFYNELPLHVLEALACGCKVVATELPGLRDWLEESAPGASVYYVKPPRMQGLDEPLKCDIADFEQRMADAIKEAVLAPLKLVDLSRLSWKLRCESVCSECAKLIKGGA